MVLPLAVGRTEHLSGGGLRGGEDRRCPRVLLLVASGPACHPSDARFRRCAPPAGRGTDLQLGGHAHQWRAEFSGATELVGFYANVLAFGYYNFGEASAMGTLIGAVLVIVAIAGWMLAFPRRVGRRRLFNNVGPQSDARAPASRVASRAWHWAANAWRRSPAAGPDEVRGTLSHSMRWAKRSRWALLAVMVVLVLLPFAGEAEFWLGRHEFSGTFWPAIETGAWNSLILSAATVVGTLVLAVPAAYFLAYDQSRWRAFLFVFVLFTLAIPGIIFILPQFEEIVWLGLVNTRIGIIVLYITANLPLAVFFLRPAFVSVPVPLVEAMRVDGASGLGSSEGLYCGSRRAPSLPCRC